MPCARRGLPVSGRRASILPLTKNTNQSSVPATKVERCREERGGTSTWQSLMRGLPTVEIDYLNGEIVLLGKQHGNPTPINATIRRLVQEVANHGQAPHALTIDDLREFLPVAAAD